MVLLYHVFVQIYPPSREIGKSLFTLLPFKGPLAVVVFFIVSGYALSIRFIATGNRRILYRMLIGRYFRLAVPILIGCMLIYAAAVSGLIQDEFRRNAASSLMGVLKFAVFDVFITDTDPLPTPVPQLWTMPTEIVGSFIVIALFCIVGRMWIRWPIFLCAFLLLYPKYAGVSSFIVGVLLAELSRVSVSATASKLLSATAACGMIFVVGAGAAWPIEPISTLMIPAVLLVAASIYSQQIRHFLSNRLSQFLGEISFPLYILHGAVIYSFGTWAMRWAHSPQTVAIVGILTTMVAILVAKMCTWMDRAGVSASRAVANIVFKPKRRSGAEEREASNQIAG